MSDFPQRTVPRGIGELRDALNDSDRRDEIADQVIAWLQEKWGDAHPCPHCGNVTWGVGGIVTTPLLGQDEVQALVPVSCTNCGNTELLSAVVIGVVESEKYKT